MQKVGVSDEWCAETFMETDYTRLQPEDFDTSLRDFLAFQVRQPQVQL
jgi:hypothetical protein